MSNPFNSLFRHHPLGAPYPNLPPPPPAPSTPPGQEAPPPACPGAPTKKRATRRIDRGTEVEAGIARLIDWIDSQQAQQAESDDALLAEHEAFRASLDVRLDPCIDSLLAIGANVLSMRAANYLFIDADPYARKRGLTPWVPFWKTIVDRHGTGGSDKLMQWVALFRMAALASAMHASCIADPPEDATALVQVLLYDIANTTSDDTCAAVGNILAGIAKDEHARWKRHASYCHTLSYGPGRFGTQEQKEEVKLICENIMAPFKALCNYELELIAEILTKYPGVARDHIWSSSTGVFLFPTGRSRSFAVPNGLALSEFLAPHTSKQDSPAPNPSH
jgi:hypothetical protein